MPFSERLILELCGMPASFTYAYILSVSSCLFMAWQLLMSHVCHSLPTHLQEDILVAAKFWWLWMNYGYLCAGLFFFIRITFNSLDKCRELQFLNNRDRFCFVRICRSVFCSGRGILPSLPPGRRSASSVFMLLAVHPDAVQCGLTVVSCAVPSGQKPLVKFSCSFFPICFSTLIKCVFKCLLYLSVRLVSLGF